VSRNPLDVRANEAELEAAALDERVARDREISDIRALMSTVPGRRFMWRLLDKAGIYKSSMTGNSQTFFLEGQRNIGLFLLAQVNDHCLDEYVQMLTENRAA
jgi:hypothetical protein